MNADQRRDPRPRPEVVLYRCDCEHCDQAEEELKKLSAARDAVFVVKRVKSEGLEKLAGWATPVVFVNGVEITHYTMNAAKWKKAIETPVERARLKGEIVDFSCYVKEHARGPEHADCAEQCVNEIRLPLGLLCEDGLIYQLSAGQGAVVEHEELKHMLGRKVEVDGDLYRWGEKCTFIVRKI